MKTGIQRADILLNKITRLVVETGTLTGTLSRHYCRSLSIRKRNAASIATMGLGKMLSLPVRHLVHLKENNCSETSKKTTFFEPE